MYYTYVFSDYFMFYFYDHYIIELDYKLSIIINEIVDIINHVDIPRTAGFHPTAFILEIDKFVPIRKRTTTNIDFEIVYTEFVIVLEIDQ